MNQPKWLMGLSALLVLWGAALLTASWRTERLAKDLPRMTCDDLVQKGRAAPQFLTLTDVHLCQAGHAFRRDMDAAMEMYLPIYSTQLKKEPRGPDLTLILEIQDDRERRRWLQRPDVGELSVELWTEASNLSPWVENRLSQVYPGLQLAKCRVVSVGLHEPSLFRAAHEKSDGITIMTLGAAVQLGWFIWRFSHSKTPQLVSSAPKAAR